MSQSTEMNAPATFAKPERRDGGLPGRLAKSLRGLARKPVYLVAVIIVLVVVVASIGADYIAPYGYNDLEGGRLESPNSTHWAGTDSLGRDQLSRIIYGSRTVVFVGVGSIVIGTLLALVIGMPSGMFKGPVDLILQRLVDAWMAFPAIVLLLTLVSVFGPSTRNMTLSLGLLLGVTSSRIIRGAVLSASAEQFVLAARSVGASELRILVRHVLPTIMPTVIILMTVNVGFSILAEASLSFLGFGTQPPQPSWGNMLSSDTQYMVIAPWLAIAPGIAITLTVFAFNMIGDGMRDWLDPRVRRV
jgi:peptide/nickel transport system permease protein